MKKIIIVKNKEEEMSSQSKAMIIFAKKHFPEVEIIIVSPEEAKEIKAKAINLPTEH